MKLLYFIFFVAFFGITQSITAQTAYKFSKRADMYPEELKSFMLDRIDKSRKNSTIEYLEQFTIFWNNDSISMESKKKVIAYSNLIIRKRMHAFPEFKLYLDALLAVARSEKGSEMYMSWLESLEPLLASRSKTNFMKFLNVSIDLFGSNILYKTAAFKWKTDNLNFSIKKEGKLPVFVFDSLDLICVTKVDSGFIYGTKGVCNPLKSRWEGEGGRVLWTRAGLAETDVYAELTNYDVKLKSNRYICDSVKFYDNRKFSFALYGRLSEKIFTSKTTKVNYPNFSSFRTDIEIKDIFRNVDYQGGYSLKGNVVVGIGSKEQSAYLIFKRKGKRFVWAGAPSFNISKGMIQAPSVSVTIYIEEDSIFHPGLTMMYNNNKRRLSIYRDDKGLSKAPFYDSYHQLDLFVESLSWDLEEDFIDLKSVAQKGSSSEATFESLSLFTQARYDRLQGIDRVNPVKAVYNYTHKIGYNEFPAEDFGRYIGMSKSVTMSLLMSLAAKGFLIYDVNEDYVIVKERVDVYIEASKGKRDYDVIGFRSSVTGIPNASLNLLNYDLIIQGVERVFLSDSQDVFIAPDHKKVTVMKNRDFKFDGYIKAGKFDMAARECTFSYEKFELDLPIIDSISFRVRSFTPNKYGEYRQMRVKNVIGDLQGNILIDRADNKSGRKSYAEYPIFNSKANAYVYYDRTGIHGGVYSKDKFYYRVDPFTIDSLDNFSTEGIHFTGYLASAGIFSDIDEPLSVQEDYSLGFVFETSESGKPIYGKKGNFTSKIKLSNQGLRGDGTLKYLTSTAHSSNFLFFPDSTNAIVSTYDIAPQQKGIEYPTVAADSTFMHWEPGNDMMEITNLDYETPMIMYSAASHMNGTLELTPTGLHGKGVVFIKDAEMVSNVYQFNYMDFDADTIDFRLKKFVDEDADIEDELSTEFDYAYETNNFKVHVDFVERKAEFEANGSAQKVEFPENMYICFMDKFTWYMDRDETEFSSKKRDSEEVANASLRDKIDLDLTGSRFISTHPDQDSLNFFAQRAVFSQRTSLITANEVQMILVADAAVYPDSGKVIIHKKAEMEDLNNAKMIVNTTTRYHELYNGSFKLLSRKKYYGRALYNYVTENGDIQFVYFSKLQVDTTGTTYGSGKVDADANFILSANFDFVGEVNLEATKEHLRFMGGTRIAHSCDTLERPSIYFNAYINPKDIRIPIADQPQSVDNRNIFAGMYGSSNGIRIYSSFIQKKRRSSDIQFFNASGVLVYDKTMHEYRISTSERLNKTNKTDNYLALNTKDCEVKASGLLNLAVKTGQLEATAYGEMRHYKRKDSTSLLVSIPLNFFFSEKALELMANDLNDRMELNPVNLQSDLFQLTLGKLVGVEESEKLMTDIATHGGAFRKVPDEVRKTLFISDVEMKWNPRTRSFVSTGQIGIASMGKIQILKYVDGKIEIKNKNGSTRITFAIDLGDKDYYFFTYNSTTGMMAAFSSNKEFVTIIKEMKSDDRKMKVKGKGKPYTYYLSTATSYKKFLRMLKLRG
ncbi:MAG: hypothetical protein KAG64_00915 [Bacteroidales bacterium]|nr:hypothetical protein [Bacteroidales bacterium]